MAHAAFIKCLHIETQQDAKLRIRREAGRSAQEPISRSCDLPVHSEHLVVHRIEEGCILWQHARIAAVSICWRLHDPYLLTAIARHLPQWTLVGSASTVSSGY